ncbi:(serine-type) D-alanyl-D-alanine carboxypeptidase [Legionella beliardensis]|uniref:(Serine-type) D-alanyl-D-alanine carboxypeptidase n=1 Tax=Legionella beliardensis TaxID=91822 RepID=A0A378JSL2_9GAMM|nr:serine hydrolase domain-containing protein [Legionella beliardensis]STX55578.1 (serine-type) D-alanyl-D-alanine carboxypeptidase [Legionella beliardensis]
MKKINIIFFYAAFLPFHVFASQLTQEKLQSLDKFVQQSMHKYHVPAVSLSLIENGKIVYTHAYSAQANIKVTPQTLFQSASVGKSVAAYGALLLVDKGKLKLDKNINNYLTSWKIPESPYTEKIPVTLRTILSMTSGLSVPGFIGQSVNSPLPTLGEILRGHPPAENPPVEVKFIPGSKYYYSGGSYEVLEQLIEDVTNLSFSNYMQNFVLNPLKMSHSRFIAILPKNLWTEAVSGYLKDEIMIKGRWNIIPALGAGGMWTTPTDLAMFTIEVIKSFHGEGKLSKELAQAMLTCQKNTDFGLGFVIDGCENTLNFRKEGHNIGFYNWLIAFPYTKQGLVIMTNSENGTPLIKDVVAEVSALLNWPTHYPIVDESQSIPATNCS